MPGLERFAKFLNVHTSSNIDLSRKYTNNKTTLVNVPINTKDDIDSQIEITEKCLEFKQLMGKKGFSISSIKENGATLSYLKMKKRLNEKRLKKIKEKI